MFVGFFRAISQQSVFAFYEKERESVSITHMMGNTEYGALTPTVTHMYMQEEPFAVAVIRSVVRSYET